jgi:hypothetical protein
LWCFLQFVFVRCSWHRGKPQEGQSPTLGLGSEHSSQSGTLEGPAICDILLGRVREKGDGSGDGDGDGDEYCVKLGLSKISFLCVRI